MWTGLAREFAIEGPWVTHWQAQGQLLGNGMTGSIGAALLLTTTDAASLSAALRVRVLKHRLLFVVSHPDA